MNAPLQHAVVLTDLQQRIINQLQGEFPLHPRPYAEAAQRLGCDEATLLQQLRQLLRDGVLTRFGPLFQVERMGGAFVLAALKVPEADYARVSALVNALPAVAHNYRREHALNMWFVLATAQPQGIATAIAQIEQDTGLTVHAFPKLREYYVGMQFAVGGQAPVGQRPGNTPLRDVILDAQDHQLVKRSQGGLALQPHPYAELAAALGCSEDAVLQRLQRMLESGVVRRIGAVPNHYAIGYRANGMVVFDVADTQVDTLGEQVGQQAFVSHCYRRPRHLPDWPYNLFAMCHGADHAAVEQQAQQLRRLLGAACTQHAVLFSSRILKKSGLRL
ncbi:Lrp/AsnC family transcriptional regulator [Leeia sp.]|uniref:siroheme decarboxylase subunit beta n=1 Tax=Leeia sp. TaxID=2884678 RepID=UPI0035AE3C96